MTYKLNGFVNLYQLRYTEIDINILKNPNDVIIFIYK